MYWLLLRSTTFIFLSLVHILLNDGGAYSYRIECINSSCACVIILSNGSILWWITCREYWIIYRGPSFLVVVWFGSMPALSPVSKLNRRHTGRLRKRDNLLTGEGGGWESGRALSRIIRTEESLVLYKSFNTLWQLELVLVFVKFAKQHKKGGATYLDILLLKWIYKMLKRTLCKVQLVVHGETPSNNKDSRQKIGKILRILFINLLVYSLFTMYIVILWE